jgi:SAM-dependent methyltransferase
MVIDLGCGDARVLIAAAQRCGCRAIGYDIDPDRVREARENVAKARVSDRVQIVLQDLFEVDVSAADVVFLYLLPQLNTKLIPQLRTLRPGARVVSHDFDIAGVGPDRVSEEYLPRLGLYKTHFLYVAPLREQQPVRHQWAESSRMGWETQSVVIPEADPTQAPHAGIRLQA